MTKEAREAVHAFVANRLPPQNVEVEQSILGALLIEQDAILKVTDKLAAEDFYREDHRVIFDHMVKLFEARKPIDVLTLTDALESSKKLAFVGGATYITTLTGMVNSAVHISYHADIVRSKAMLRKLISAASRISELGYKEDSETDEILDQAESLLFGVSQNYLSNNFVAIGSVLSESFDRIDELHKTKGALRGVPTGFKELDNLLGGLQKSDLVILAARPSMGKCVTGNTRILNPETGASETIEMLVQMEQGTVTTLTDDWQFQAATPQAFVADGVKPTFKVKTALGREIEATLPHPFLTIKGWKKLGELSPGDRIAVPRQLPFFGKVTWPDHQIKVLAYLLTDGTVTGTKVGFTNTNPVIVADFKSSVLGFGPMKIVEQDSHGTRASTYTASVDSSQYQASRAEWGQAFSAYLIANKKKVYAAIADIGMSDTNHYQWQKGVVQPSRETIGRLKKRIPDLPVPGHFNVNPIQEFLIDLNVAGKNAHAKTIPHEVFKFTKPKLALFLNRMFSCDGCAMVAKTRDRLFPIISYSSVSRTMIYQVQHLLLRFGILAKVREKHVKYKETRRTAYELEIHGSREILTFVREIGIYGKEAAVEKVAAVARQTGEGWTKDTLPIEIWDKIAEAKGNRSWRSIYAALGMPLSHNIHAFRRAPRRETVLKLATVLEDEELRQLAQSDVYWDRILSIESTGMKPVYDLTIPETHNFVANDIVVHNTSLALNIAENAAIKAKAKVGIFSLEQSREQLVDRLLSSVAGVDSWKIRSGNLNDEDFPLIGKAMGVLSEAPIFIDDTPGLSALELRTKARRLQMESGLDLIVVDYLQLMHGKSQENRVQEVSEISRALKGVARELNVPVIALSQLSRAVESRPDKRPMLSDLRDSGSIEQDSDVVLFIYRDDYYDKDSEKKNIAEILVRKHRNGPVGEVDLYFQPEQTRFRNLTKRGN